ncbi:1-acyl-sn-glycerol-3-phosphate acyltransferase [Flagellimonas myxillae]|uniref:1-acyl-sn-glycerol-3-phosphate acyltransferase n=1 Tax=Flagellimonas myxillae TaxID=2942214 RepID=UPI00201E9806|nr:1-acyl-sn-glycerol-3-phosphate acyltransferase [Muricauda myxillae]MCL6265233.1 1-acyl-sn-glycerol-3-phosphate acyltransferase [Muricauda myxillae]
MKQLTYQLIKLWIKLGLYCYYRKITPKGTEHIPKDKPVLFLSNHQNALMDVLLIATHVKRKPWFLTRSDVFKGGLVNGLFGFLQMLPIYRIRDGKSNLHKNKLVFDQCGNLFGNKEAILIFPEANHSLKRRVRPLSKGFARIITNALQQNPELDIQLVPIGQNYAYPRQVGDSAAPHFGRPIPVRKFLDSADFVGDIKLRVFEGLTALTTHIPESMNDELVQKIGTEGKIYLNPMEVNAMVPQNSYSEKLASRRSVFPRILKSLFYVWNLPFVLLWRVVIKPKVPEPEFEATFRFGFMVFVYPLCYLILLLALWKEYTLSTACLVILGHAMLNILLVKMGIASPASQK